MCGSELIGRRRCVDVPAYVCTPPEFKHAIEKVVRHSRVVWRKDTRIGVRFEVPADG
jgi:hypothetical protein